MAEHGKASFIIRDKVTKEVICECFNVERFNNVNADKYEAVWILDYLVELNRNIKEVK